MILYDKQGWSMSLQKLLLGEITAIVDNQINKAIFYILYLLDCSLALDIH